MLPGILKGYMSNSQTGTLLKSTSYTFGSGSGLSGSGTTTNTGAYFLQLPSGTYTLTFNIAGYNSVKATVTIPSNKTVTKNLGFTPK